MRSMNYQKTSMTCLARQLAIGVFFVLAMLISSLASAQTPGAGGLSFNHNTTGFFLDGAHAKETCDACHTQGQFRGTPRDCATCHRIGGRAPGKPTLHIPTTTACDTCHGNVSWVPSSFRHQIIQGVVQGACNTCHNGSFATGKPSTHVQTSSSCDSCHKTSAWLPAGYSHALVAPGSCATCHNGIRSTGKPATHIPTTASCDACHAAGVSFAPISVSVSGMHSVMAGPAATGACSTCHSGSFVTQNAQAKPSTHIPTTAQCDTCHTSTTSWATALQPDHTTMSPPAMGRCSDCHNGVLALGKPTKHIPTLPAQQCDVCHTSFTAFKPAQMSHLGTVGLCSSCHNGSYTFANAQSKPNTHIPTSAQCDTCHVRGFVNWSPATMDHTGMAGKCSTCHSGVFISQNAQTKPATHVSTSAQCDSCHSSTTSWATAVFNHAGVTPAVTGRCSTCHNGASALGKPSTHIPTSAQCDRCHSGYTAFRPATMNHAGMSGQCSTCHNGSYLFANALTRPANHIPSIAQCDTCHVSGFVNWSPATMNHSGLAGQCSACHSGTYIALNAQVKPLLHLSTSAQCDSCHNSTTSWATAVFNHGLASPPVAGRCSTCHIGKTAAPNTGLGKPTNHIPTTAQCDTCHTNTTAFAPAITNHGSTTGPGAAGNCSTCHSGAYKAVNAQVKPANHIPTLAQCDTCHGSTSTWTGGVYTHGASATGACSTCHSGAYLASNALAKPVSHVPTGNQCDTCHRSTTNWKTSVFYTHDATAPNNCSTCHNGSYTAINALPKPTSTHIPTSKQCDTCHTNFVAFAPAKMNHTGLTGQCSTCHSGTYVSANALSKPGSHIPTGAQCDVCHVNGFVAFAPGVMSHAGTNAPVAAGNCSTCHSGAYLAQNAQMKPGTHVSTAAQCDTCHSSTTSWATAVFNHATASPAVSGRCSTCHNGTNALGKSTAHIPTTAQCDTCHTGFVAFAPGLMNHSGTSGNCISCHNGGYVSVNAQIKPTTHIPTGVQQCDTCHTTVAWKPTSYAHQGVVAGSCATCHNGTAALGKSLTHLPTSASCDVCHTNYIAFAPTKMNHAGTTGPLAANSCSTCHAGAYVTINAQIKSPTHVATTAQCDTCHTTTVSWATVTYVHEATAVGVCSTCHNGVTALGKPTNHIPTTAQCSTCHNNYNAFRPAVMSHAGTTGPVAVANCSSCHNGNYIAVNALAKPATHIPTTSRCDTCHTRGYAAWSPSVMNHAGLTGQCSTCHSGAYLAQNAQTKTPTHISTTAQCDTCHNSTITWATGVYNHATAVPAATGRCSTCHNGTNALGKPSNHIPTTAQCDACHKNYTAFPSPIMSHTLTTGPSATGNCASCHNGAYIAANAQAKNVTHIPTTQSCDVCHTTTLWKPTSFAHVGVVAGTCATCHNNVNASGKSTPHIPTAQSCENCHRTGISWLPLITPYSHTGVASTGCSNCHSSAYPNIDVKPANHLPTTAACESCHHSFVNWLPTTFNHAGVGTICQTCHSGTYSNIMAKPANHIPTLFPTGMPGNECSICHIGTTTFTNGRMGVTGHGSMQTSCITCHDSTATYLGSMIKSTRTANHHGANAVGKDCSSSGCHRPLGNIGSKYTAWN